MEDEAAQIGKGGGGGSADNMSLIRPSRIVCKWESKRNRILSHEKGHYALRQI